MNPKIIQLPLGPLQTNCYLLGCLDTNQAAIIDPSWDGDAAAKLANDEGLTISHILLTHSHFDHIGGLAALKRATDAPIYAHAATLPMLKMGQASAMRWGIEIEEPPEVDHLLIEGDQLQVGELTLEVLFTPGHAPGHLCFYLPAFSILFSGDALFQGSIGRTDLPGGDLEILMRSIFDKLMPLPDETQLLSGHGAATTIGQERQFNPFLQDNL